MALRPIGSVVRLRDAQANVIIIGYAKKHPKNHGEVYDYIGVKYPEGYDGKKGVLFNEDMIGEGIADGLLDPDSIHYVDVAAAELELRRNKK